MCVEKGNVRETCRGPGDCVPRKGESRFLCLLQQTSEFAYWLSLHMMSVWPNLFCPSGLAFTFV